MSVVLPFCRPGQYRTGTENTRLDDTSHSPTLMLRLDSESEDWLVFGLCYDWLAEVKIGAFRRSATQGSHPCRVLTIYTLQPVFQGCVYVRYSVSFRWLCCISYDEPTPAFISRRPQFCFSFLIPDFLGSPDFNLIT